MTNATKQQEDGAAAGVPWRTFLAAAVERLRAAGIANAAAEARWLVEAVSGFDGPELAGGLGQPATVGGVGRLEALLARRVKGEPLQYVLGRWSFRTLDLMVDPRVLIPRPETEVVAGVALEELARQASAPGASGRQLRAVDLGTGSGAIGLALAAECAAVGVVLTDVSPDARAVALANTAGLGWAGTRVRIRSGSWFSALDPAEDGPFHLVVSNPPYIGDLEQLPAEVVDWEPPDALRAGPRGTEAIELLLHEARGWLHRGGAVVLELAPAQANVMVALARDDGYGPVTVRPDLSGRDRVLVARWPG